MHCINNKQIQRVFWDNYLRAMKLLFKPTEKGLQKVFILWTILDPNYLTDS